MTSLRAFIAGIIISLVAVGFVAPTVAFACTCTCGNGTSGGTQASAADCASACGAASVGSSCTTAPGAPTPAPADTLGGGLLQQVGGAAHLNTAQTPEGFVSVLVNTALSVLGVIFLILLIYGGYMWMQARGNEEYVTKAKNTIINAVIGIILVLVAYAISVFIIEQVFKAAT